MTTLREAAQMALEALQESKPIDIDDPAAFYRSAHAIEALRAALAAEQDDGYCQACEGNYCTAKDGCVARDNPPQREWQGLTDEEIENCFEMSMFGTCRAIEAKLREKNDG